MNRTHAWLAAALVVQLALIALVNRPGADGANGDSRPFIPQLDGLDVTRIELVDDTGARLELRRTDSAWTIPDADGFPADAAKIAALVDDLRALEVRRPTVRRARHHDTFRVSEDDFIGRLRIWGADDEPAADLLLGDATNYRTTYARLADQDAVYEVVGLAPFDLRPRREAWVRKVLLDASAADVVGLDLTNGSGSLTLELDDGVWGMADGETLGEGLEVDPAVVDSLLRTVTDARIVDSAGAPDPAPHGLAPPAAEFEIRLADGRTRRLLVGGSVADSDGKRYASVDGLEFDVTVWESSLRAVLETSRDALLRPASTDGSPD